MPLRTRIVIILVVLVAVALAAIEPITYTTTRNSLIQKVNAQMAASVGAVTNYFDYLAGLSSSRSLNLVGVQSPTYAQLYEPDGTPVQFPPAQPGGKSGNPVIFYSGTCPDHCKPTPDVSAAWVRQIGASPGGNGVITTVGGSYGRSFQLLGTVVDLHGGFGPGSAFGTGTFVLVLGFPLTGVDETMGHILALEIIIGLCILAALALVSWFIIRMELRPLEQMATTASEIAAGDLTKRVEDVDPRTEVGQLGIALNAMLNQIEGAFREREASEERLRRFVGDASHELRTPLTSIRGYAELFKDGRVERPEDLAAALSRIESESARMGILVDDLLLLARLDQGRPLSQEPVDLAKLAADAVQDAGVIDPARSLRLISGGPCNVFGDEQRLRQVLSNLLVNALTYSPAGSPIEVAVRVEWPAVDVSGLPGAPTLPAIGRFGRISRAGRPGGGGAGAGAGPAPARPRPLGASDLSVVAPDAVGAPAGTPEAAGAPASGNGTGASARPDVYAEPDVGPPGTADEPRPSGGERAPEPAAWAGARAVVAVIDHGPGIAPEDAPHVFERFWRADQSRQRSSGGTGLGLSIVAAVVAAHGGQVRVEETPGGGATFVVDFPAAPAPPSSPPPTSPSSDEQPQEPAPVRADR